MADVVGRSGQFVYLRVRMPGELLDRLGEQYQGESRALRAVRLEWGRVVSEMIERARRNGSSPRPCGT